MTGKEGARPRAVALVGPYQSGKTTLLESILHMTGMTGRKGSVTAGTTVGDSSPEARAHLMGVELNAATAVFMDDSFTFLDCPGSVEFFQDTLNAVIGVDAAIVVCEPDPVRVMALTPYTKALDDQGVPYIIFVNKIDKAVGRVQELKDALQAVLNKPVVLRQIPLRDGENITGYVDLASSRAYVYRKEGPSKVIDAPSDEGERIADARYQMLETLADFDDHLMEELLEDVDPSRDEIFSDLTADLRERLIVPVMFGAGDTEHGVFRLLKVLRHETPDLKATMKRIGADAIAGDVLGQVIKTYYTQHGGKLSLTRIYKGKVKEGDILNGERVSGVLKMMGGQTEKLSAGSPGRIVALARMDGVKTGDTLKAEPGGDSLAKAEALAPVYGLAAYSQSRGDEVKLTAALSKASEEDPSISYEQNPDTHQLVIWGQGEMHLRVAVERLKSKSGLSLRTEQPQVPYKESIRKSIVQRGRHKKQSGGHGQFGDVVIEVKPLPRGSGFQFTESIKGGVVPKQYIPSVEAGIRDYMVQGPLGFPVVDFAVELQDGSYHSVDSSDQAFRIAGRIAVVEALPNCQPVLLEPILSVDVFVPSEFTSNVNGLITGHRGQMLGFDARPGWTGWDVVHAYLPQSEMVNLIVELRSLTQGTGTFNWQFDHLSELVGRLADQVVSERSAA